MTNTETATAPLTGIRKLAVDTDTKLAELDAEYGKLADRHQAIGSTLRRFAGAKRRQVSRNREEWDMTISEAAEAVPGRIASGAIESYSHDTARQYLVKLDEVRTAQAANRAKAEALEAIHDEYGWARFFLVRNTGGHIHRDLSAHRCSRTATTSHGWLPELSALTEADAVAAHGTILCSVCFPSAPVEWTVGKAKPARCAGSGKAPVARENETRRMPGRYRECSGCHTGQVLTSGGVIRAHKPQD